MEKKDKDIEFIPNIGLGKIRFSFGENQVTQLLGSPDESIHDRPGDSDSSVVRLFYNELQLSFHFHFENGTYEYMSIHTPNIVLADQNFSKLTCSDILKVVESYHDLTGIVYTVEHSVDSSVNEECFSFDNLGLTVWFEQNKISDICVNKVMQ